MRNGLEFSQTRMRTRSNNGNPAPARSDNHGHSHPSQDLHQSISQSASRLKKHPILTKTYLFTNFLHVHHPSPFILILITSPTPPYSPLSLFPASSHHFPSPRPLFDRFRPIVLRRRPDNAMQQPMSKIRTEQEQTNDGERDGVEHRGVLLGTWSIRFGKGVEVCCIVL